MSRRRRRAAAEAAIQARGGIESAALLALLTRRSGAEHLAQLVSLGQNRGFYHLTVRGPVVRVTGPSGETRETEHTRFLEIFTGYLWADAAPTGVLTDMGPLFEQPA